MVCGAYWSESLYVDRKNNQINTRAHKMHDNGVVSSHFWSANLLTAKKGGPFVAEDFDRAP